MAEAVFKLSQELNLTIQYLNQKQAIKLEPETKYYVHKISYFADKFNKYYEKTTPKTVLSSLYNCEGRLKFYADKMLYIYLEIGEQNAKKNNQRSAALWPVKCTWNLEIIDEDKQQSFSLGHASCVFNRPRQGFVAHPNDWISIDLAKIVNSRCIAPDGSATLKWTVVTTPMLQLENIEELKKKLEELQKFCHNYEGPEELLTKIMKKFNENGDSLMLMNNKLCQLETTLGELKKNFDIFKTDTDQVIQLINEKKNHIGIPPAKRARLNSDN